MKIPQTFLKEAAERCKPEAECVALLFGHGEIVKTWRWLKNVLESPTAFRLDPEELYRALTEAEEKGLSLLAIFHTHPGPPTPSPIDLRYMKIWRVVWVISNVYTWETAAWRLDERGLVKV